MKFLSFFKDIDTKRRRTKRIAINLLYLLIPVVILATSFTNDRIITECEDIHHYNTELQQEIKRIKKECNTSQRESGEDNKRLEDEISQLERDRRLIREELAELEAQRESIIEGNSTLADEARRYREERDQAREQNDRLNQELITTREEGRSMRDRASRCEQVSRELEEKLNILYADKEENQDIIEDLDRRLDDQQRAYDELKENCNEGLDIKYRALEEDNRSLREENTDLRNRLDKCEGDNTRSSRDYVEFLPFKETALMVSGPAKITLNANSKYAVEVNGNVVTSICTGKCSN